MRDSTAVVLLLSLAHVNVNVLSTGEGPCAYDGPFNLAITLFSLSLFAVPPVLTHFQPTWLSPAWERRLPLLRDGLLIIPGAWFQMAVKPSKFFASVWVAEGCTMRESGQAQLMWTLGEVLSFGSAYNLLRHASRVTLLWAALLTPLMLLLTDFASKQLTDLLSHA